MMSPAVADPHRRVAAQPADRQERRPVLREAGGLSRLLRRHEIPGVPGVLTPAAVPADGGVDRRDAGVLRRAAVVRRRSHRPVGPRRERDGADRRRACGSPPARRSTGAATMQRADGSWPIQMRNGVIEDANSDSNFCAYIATGVWHHVLVTGDRGFAETMWPRRQQGHRLRARPAARRRRNRLGAEATPGIVPEALLTGCASIYHSIRCALALANYLDEPQPEWEVAVGSLGHAIAEHPESFIAKDRCVDGVVLPGARRRAARRRRAGRASTSAGTSSSSPVSASAASTTGRG